MSTKNTPADQFQNGSPKVCCEPGSHNFQARFKGKNELILIYEICTHHESVFSIMVWNGSIDETKILSVHANQGVAVMLAAHEAVTKIKVEIYE